MNKQNWIVFIFVCAIIAIIYIIIADSENGQGITTPTLSTAITPGANIPTSSTGITPGATSSTGITPGANIPTSSTAITPGATTSTGITPGATTSTGITPGATTSTAITPGATTSTGITPGATTSTATIPIICNGQWNNIGGCQLSDHCVGLMRYGRQEQQYITSNPVCRKDNRFEECSERDHSFCD